MQIEFAYYPGGVRRALTMSFDDGKLADIRLAELFKQYGIKATFHYNSGNIGKETYVTADDIKKIAEYHEVSCHGQTHAFLDKIPSTFAVTEILEDKKSLENITGGLVRGMSYPYGTYTKDVLKLLPMLGIEYSRTIANTNSCYIPDDFLEWHPTCHQSHDIVKMWNKLMKFNKHIRLLYIWGHSYEFDRDNSWDRMEEFCKMAGGCQEVWYATNIEIKDYITALRSLVFSSDKKIVYNPSALTVWFGADGEILNIKPGETLKLN